MNDLLACENLPEISCNGCTHLLNFVKPKLEELSKTIVEKTKENKSVTKANKQCIINSATEILQLASKFQPCILQANAASALDSPTRSAPLDFSALNSLMGNMRAEIADIKKLLSTSNKNTDNLNPTSYADAVRKTLTPAPIRASSKPALIVTSSIEGQSKESILKSWRQHISFRSMTFLPTKIIPVSNNKLRVEFDNAEERGVVLDMVNASGSELSAEVARQLRPMIIVKGINKDVPIEQLLPTIKQQNISLTSVLDDNDMTLKFVRKNRREHLYNAVFVISPQSWKYFANMDRINIDHQKVHIEEFCPFLQCYKCMQFGHTRNKCSSALAVCSHCGGTDHVYSECKVRHDLHRTACFNCKNYNLKYNAHRDTRHSATSHTCSAIQFMKTRIMQRIDYNGS